MTGLLGAGMLKTRANAGKGRRIIRQLPSADWMWDVCSRVKVPELSCTQHGDRDSDTALAGLLRFAYQLARPRWNLRLPDSAADF